ncbi:pyridoxal phosphate-dependent decarboxylase family protein [Pseudemcibacter aquimaris]|uniref:pyridoxal phosphate-dependent decarboxylase family protein n=1 Tax=Pseudemcibacter aquimaris TaxID=2857064 RepID=UPI0020113C7A|nr:pyridoxal-dependent decarboxylase [Pseudemcibacter aquimaris]MCC3859884.1 aminotransferase class V-fold PLP-dependent enzyme [Pseudemcibacter aquimaris]WDU57216.1 aminotransferase class V-fold PLP-dependent enzyme [Pseudemcibacter aquimaris]
MKKNDCVFDAAYQASYEYLKELNERDIMPTDAAIASLKSLHIPMPDDGQNDVDVINELHEIGSPNTVASTGGRYFGFVVGGALPVTMAAHWLSTVWDQNAGTWILSPIAGELEDVAGKWMLDLLDLPRDAVFGFVTGATMATFSSIAAARSALLKRKGFDVKKSGLFNAPKIRIIMSEEIHPTNIAAFGYAGFGLDQIEYVPVDEEGRIIVDEMPELDDLSIVILQAGNINSGSFDDFDAVTRIANDAGAWVHVDGAFGLWARASAEKKHLTHGIEKADSWSVDGHKWLNLPQDSAIYFCRDGDAVNDVFGVTATYLMRDQNRQGNNYTPELSRRARGVEFWAALKSLGAKGVAEIVDRSCYHAVTFTIGLKEMGFTVMNDVVLNQVVFAVDDQEKTKAILEHVQNSGVVWLGPTTWKDKYAMRISVSSAATTDIDVRKSLKVFERAYQKVMNGNE